MNVVFYTIFLYNVIILAIVAAMSRSTLFGKFSGSALNPFVVYCVISILINIDFITVYTSPTTIDFLETKSFVEPSIVLNAYCVATLIATGGAFGLLGALAAPSTSKAESRIGASPAARMSAMIIGIVGGIIQILVLAYSRAASSDDLISFQIMSRENPAFAAAAWGEPMALAIFLAHLRSPFSLAGGAVSALTIFPLVAIGGPRTMPLVCLLIIAVAYSNHRKISALYYLPMIPVVGAFLAFSRYTFRETGYASFGDFVVASGGMWNLFFAGQEISFAKMFATVYAFAHDLPSINPMHGLIASLLAPIPRALIPWKPFGVSGVFTEYISPVRWELTKSETLVSGCAELYWEWAPSAAASHLPRSVSSGRACACGRSAGRPPPSPSGSQF